VPDERGLQPADLLQVGPGEPAGAHDPLHHRPALRRDANLQHLLQLRLGLQLHRGGEQLLPGLLARQRRQLPRDALLLLLHLRNQPQLQLDLLPGLHGGRVDGQLHHGDVAHQLRRLLLVLGQLQLDLLPGLLDRHVDLDLHRRAHVHLLDV
jgi:hypothetical protein